MIPLLALESPSLTFSQQLWLMVLEKLGIGIIIVVAVFASQWIIEWYKGRRALWTEMSKERVKHIAQDWDEMNKWDGIVGDLYVKLQSLLEERLGMKTQRAAGRPELSETIAFLKKLDLSTISDTLTEQCKSELDPLIKRSERQSAKVSNTLQNNRFWLGKDLYDHCRKFQKTLHDICVSFGTMDFRDLEKLARELNDRRQDVLTTLKLVK